MSYAASFIADTIIQIFLFNFFCDTIEKLASTGKTICFSGDFNLCLLKTEKSQYSQDFLLAPTKQLSPSNY